jgi:hypothetical protein
MKAARFIAWILLYLVLFTAFFILFENGPTHFVEGAQQDLIQVKKVIGLSE